ncbi:hypothetical protein Bbelb_026700 [Branchiostoma belcheri]|nr:hypothetical protein Bbelb_026700 [Branchiostoma belcheri]
MEVTIAVLVSSRPGSEESEVPTKYGRISGYITDYNGAGVRAFLGVPFAKPPTGELRFMPPEEPEPCDGVREATGFGSVCPQESMYLLGFAEPFATVSVPWSEDCLYLNVHATVRGSSAEDPLAVMVYITEAAGRPGRVLATTGLSWLPRTTSSWSQSLYISILAKYYLVPRPGGSYSYLPTFTRQCVRHRWPAARRGPPMTQPVKKLKTISVSTSATLTPEPQWIKGYLRLLSKTGMMTVYVMLSPSDQKTIRRLPKSALHLQPPLRLSETSTHRESMPETRAFGARLAPTALEVPS